MTNMYDAVALVGMAMKAAQVDGVTRDEHPRVVPELELEPRRGDPVRRDRHAQLERLTREELHSVGALLPGEPGRDADRDRAREAVGRRARLDEPGHDAVDVDPFEGRGNAEDVLLLLVDLDHRPAGRIQADTDSDDPGQVEQPLGVALLHGVGDREPWRRAARRPLALTRRRERDRDERREEESYPDSTAHSGLASQ